jgi:hypothetical protein
LFTLVSTYADNLSLVVIGFFEVITVAYAYGMCIFFKKRICELKTYFLEIRVFCPAFKTENDSFGFF